MFVYLIFAKGVIYIVRIAGRSLLSVISDVQKDLLCKLNVKLEVD